MHQQNSEKSSFIFLLAEEAGISLKPGDECFIEDETYFAFRDKYKVLAQNRDNALRRHLTLNKPLFRVYLPYRRRAFNLAYQIIWYMDEVIIKDPVGEAIFLADTKNKLERSKAQLRTALQFLAHFRSGIELGYLLLGGHRAISQGQQELSPEAKEFLEAKPEISELLESETRFRMLRRADERDQVWLFTRIELDSVWKMGMHFPDEGKGAYRTAPPWTPGEVFPECTAEEMARAMNKDISDIRTEARELFPGEVKNILQQAVTAVEINAAILFDRKVDAVILNAAAGAGSTAPSDKKQRPTATAFNLVLPYLEGVPPKVLLELRNELPEHFKEFRSRLVDIVSRAAQADPENVTEHARLIADRELLPATRGLEAEMEAASKKAKILGYIPTAVLTMGSLLGNHYDLLPASWIAGAVIGLAAGPLSTAAAAYAVDKKNATRNPFYFLWHARKERR